MPKAYSYLRFSTAEQALGDSHRRQSALAEEYAERHGLSLDRSLTYRDLGVSAYSGANVETGRLGDFLEAVRSGRVPKGAFLLVESLDRISRQAARKAFRVLEDIVDAGVTVVTLNDGRSYDSETLDKDQMALLIALLIFIRANEESETKSRRLKAAWSNKRANAAQKPLTSRVPPWLRLNSDRAFEVIEERAEIVRRIFGLAYLGIGEHSIAQSLNADGVEPFGDGSRKAKFWHRSYIAKILRNPAVFGRLIPHTVQQIGGKTIRTPQTPVDDYYPSVIEKQRFERVRSIKATASPLRGRHAHAPVQNMLGGVAKCPICGSSMTRVSKGSSKRSGRPYLVCTKAKAGKGCEMHSVKLDQVESALVGSADTLVRYGAVRADRALRDEGILLRRHISQTESVVQNLVEAISRTPAPSDALLRQLSEAERRLLALRNDRTALADKIGANRDASSREQYRALRDALKRPEIDRNEINAALRRLVSDVVVDFRSGDLLIRWKNDVETRVSFSNESATKEAA